MAFISALFGFLLIVIGVVGFASPPKLLVLVSRLQSQRGLYLVAAIRIVFGAALLFTASVSRAPAFLRVLGVIALISGVITPFFGVRRFEAVLGWWSRQPRLFLRLWCAVVVALGAGIVWAVAP